MSKTKFFVAIILLLSFFSLSISTGFAQKNKVVPPIYWSQKKVEINAGSIPFSINVEFESNKSLSNVSLWVVPELQPFISVTPVDFATIDPGTPYSVSIDVSIPYDTEIGSLYDGTIHLRDGKSTIPQTLKVALSIVFGSPYVSLSELCTANSEVTASGSTLGGTTVQILGGSSFIETDVINGAFSVGVPLNLNQVNHLFFTAIDANGTPSAPTAVQVIQDGEPPSLFIDFPEDGMELTTETTDVTGRVGDMLSGFLGLDVTVNGAPAEVIVGIGNNGTFVRLSVPLAIGPNTISATATDKKRNIISREITVERIEIPDDARIMEVLSGNGQRRTVNEVLPDPVVVKVTRSDNTPFVNKIVNFKVTRSDGRLTPDGVGDGSLEFQVHTDANGLAQAFWKLGTDAGCGNNRIEATSEDIVGSTFFCASADPNNPKQINIGSGNNQRAEADGPAPGPLRVWVNDTCNGVEGVPVTFTPILGGGKVNGADSATVNTGITGHAEVDFTLGPDQGNNLIEADFPGNPGNPAVFVVFGIVRDETQPTGFTGIVLNNSSQPVGGATCSLVIGTEILPIIAETDYDGICVFNNITGSGPAKLFVDGLTATAVNGQPVSPGSFPALSFETVIVPNAANSLPTPVLLPALNPNNARNYDGAQDVELTVEGIDGLKMLVKAGSMTRADGTVPTTSNPATLALNQVHFDDVPMPMPDGAAPPFAWTLQPSGATFDPPVEVAYPNMSGLPAGAIAYFLSFNHDTNRFEIVATGRVTDDGSEIISDPGAGIFVAGWGCNCPPYSVTGDCEDECKNDTRIREQIDALKVQQNAAMNEAERLFAEAQQIGQGAIGGNGAPDIEAFLLKLTALRVSWNTAKITFAGLRPLWATARIACLISVPEPTPFGEIACAALLLATSADFGLFIASSGGTIFFAGSLINDITSFLSIGQAILKLDQALQQLIIAADRFAQIQALCAVLAVSDATDLAINILGEKINLAKEQIQQAKEKAEEIINEINSILPNLASLKEKVEAWKQELDDFLNN